jgi:hypothetical protein
MEILQCGVCGSWRQADLFPSANAREDATTPDNNFVCLLCQREVREMKEMERALDEYEKGRRRLQSLISTLLPGSQPPYNRPAGKSQN